MIVEAEDPQTLRSLHHASIRQYAGWETSVTISSRASTMVTGSCGALCVSSVSVDKVNFASAAHAATAAILW